MFGQFLNRIYAIRHVEASLRAGRKPDPQMLDLAGLQGLDLPAFTALPGSPAQRARPAEQSESMERFAVDTVNLYA